jgi:hypothetical protein
VRASRAGQGYCGPRNRPWDGGEISTAATVGGKGSVVRNYSTVNDLVFFAKSKSSIDQGVGTEFFTCQRNSCHLRMFNLVGYDIFALKVGSVKFLKS